MSNSATEPNVLGAAPCSACDEVSQLRAEVYKTVLKPLEASIKQHGGLSPQAKQHRELFNYLLDAINSILLPLENRFKNSNAIESLNKAVSIITTDLSRPYQL